MEAKRIAAERAVDDVRDGMIVGLGTGSTAYYAIQRLGLLVQQGLSIQAIATSVQSELLAKQLGIPLVAFSERTELDLTIDGADEVDPAFHLIKGGGGALLREKIVAASSRQFTIVVDEHKVVTQLGKFALPVEIVKFGCEATIRKLYQLDCEPNLRVRDGKLYITDNGNYIADCHFGRIDSPVELHRELNLIPGVVDNGLFVGMTQKVIVGYENGDVQVLEK